MFGVKAVESMQCDGDCARPRVSPLAMDNHGRNFTRQCIHERPNGMTMLRCESMAELYSCSLGQIWVKEIDISKAQS